MCEGGGALRPILELLLGPVCPRLANGQLLKASLTSLASHPEPQDNVDWRRAGFMSQIVDERVFAGSLAG